MKKVIFTVTNDLTYDQRMARICYSLATNGYEVLLIGRKARDSRPLEQKVYRQKRLGCWFPKGKLFYAEYNIRLFFYLLFQKMDAVCAIDLDSIIPCYYISKWKKVPRIYDAHELFCEMKEVVTRPPVYRFWKWVERKFVPHFQNGYTVNHFIAKEFERDYHVHYEIIRNVPVLRDLQIPNKQEKYLLYQGTVNEGRSFETLIPAMQFVNSKLIICGDGNFMPQTKALVKKYGLEEKVIFKGKIPPAELWNYTIHAYAGITIFENKGRSNYYSLANRFFDYINAGVPQLCVDYPVYKELNNQYEIAVLINDLDPIPLSQSLNRLLEDAHLYTTLQQNCLQARLYLNWEEEEKKLLSFYKKVFVLER